MSDRRSKRQRPSNEQALDVEDDVTGEGRQPARRHIGRACSSCRESHNKCDGGMPECGTCRIHKRTCNWSLTFDRRRKVHAPDLEQANAIITALEQEVSRLRQFCRSKGIDVDKELPPSVNIAVFDMPVGIGIGGGGVGSTLPVLEGTSPVSAASNGSSPWLSSIGTPSPYSMSNSLPSPHLTMKGQFLDVPMGGYGRGGYYSEDEAAQLPTSRDRTLAGHTALPSGNLYYKTFIDTNCDSMTGIQGAPHHTTTSSWKASWCPFFPGEVPALTDNFELGRMTVHNNATERRNVVTTPGCPNTGEEALAAERTMQAYAFQSGNAAPGLLFTGV